MVTINPGFKEETSRLDGKVLIRPYSALELTKHFEPDSFGAVFGVAILEHIPTTPVLLDQIHQVTSSGAIVYLHGGPIWTSARGHHVWVRTDDVHYRFNADSAGSGLNPIPNYFHLLNDKETMLAYLRDEGIPEAHAEKIAAHVYESPNLSRITYRDFRQAVENSPFRQIAWIDKRAAFRPDEDTARKLASLDSAEGQDHSVQGVTFVLARP